MVFADDPESLIARTAELARAAYEENRASYVCVVCRTSSATWKARAELATVVSEIDVSATPYGDTTRVVHPNNSVGANRYKHWEVAKISAISSRRSQSQEIPCPSWLEWNLQQNRVVHFQYLIDKQPTFLDELELIGYTEEQLRAAGWTSQLQRGFFVWRVRQCVRRARTALRTTNIAVPNAASGLCASAAFNWAATRDKTRDDDVRMYDHLVIDEAQDFGAVELTVLLASVRARTGVTIVGDLNQKLLPDADFIGWDALAAELGVTGAQVTRLEVVHRSTSAIMRVADSILGEQSEPDRLGAKPTLVFADDHESLIACTAELARAAYEENRASHVCVVFRTSSAASKVASQSAVRVR